MSAISSGVRRKFYSISQTSRALICHIKEHMEASAKISPFVINPLPLHPELSECVARNERLREADEVLTNAECLAMTLQNIEFLLLQTGADLQTVLTQEYGEGVIMDSEMTPREFLDVVGTGKPILDVGVSPIHGKFSHWIQNILIRENLGDEHASEIIEYLAQQSPIFDSLEEEGRFVSMWDHLFDRPTPFVIKNENNLACFDALANATQAYVKNGPVLDARSPEWLTTIIAIAPCDTGICLLKDEVLNDLASRGSRVHNDMFISGFENQEYINAINGLMNEVKSQVQA